MHDHNNGKGNNSMMWMMAICCGLPLLLILFVGGGGRTLGASTWVVFGGMAVMILAHFFMIGKHKHGSDSDKKHEMTGEENKDENSKNDKNNSGHGCCH